MASREQPFLGRRMPGAIKVEKAEGSFIFDNQGRKYIDFVMGVVCRQLRWGNAIQRWILIKQSPSKVWTFWKNAFEPL
jgi:acetylornithine/succinyldiaminopimelate/putrescine aminotransferase